jgi:hypothetical protein
MSALPPGIGASLGVLDYRCLHTILSYLHTPADMKTFGSIGPDMVLPPHLLAVKCDLG